MKLTDLRNAKEVLLGKKVCSTHSKYNRQCCECKCQFIRNTAIDAYNNVDFGGDVEELARWLAHEDGWVDEALRNAEKEYFLPYTVKAKAIIASMPTWVVVKKGGV